MPFRGGGPVGITLVTPVPELEQTRQRPPHLRRSTLGEAEPFDDLHGCQLAQHFR